MIVHQCWATLYKRWSSELTNEIRTTIGFIRQLYAIVSSRAHLTHNTKIIHIPPSIHIIWWGTYITKNGGYSNDQTYNGHKNYEQNIIISRMLLSRMSANTCYLSSLILFLCLYDFDDFFLFKFFCTVFLWKRQILLGNWLNQHQTFSFYIFGIGKKIHPQAPTIHNTQNTTFL